MHALRIHGEQLPSGVYFVRLAGERFVAHETVVLLR
jgi:hypothetical protein